MSVASKALVSVSVIALSTAIASQIASAQQIEEIVVTGTKRDEKLLDAPIAVQVFTEQAIQRAGIERPQDFLNLTSNITFIQTNHAGEAFVNVRGQTSVRQSESAVAVVIDGVQLATQNEFNGELFDVQQIEVLKGPQSALYGRNATAGAIIITTKPPTDKFEASVSGGYGNWNSSRATASAGGAIVPGKLRFRASLAFSDSDGPFTNIITGEKPYRSNEKLGRARLDWELSDQFTADFRIGGSRLIGGAIAANAQGPNIVNGGVRSPVNTNFFDPPYVTDVPGYNRQDKFNTSLKMDYKLTEATITSVSAYSRITDLYQAHLFPYQSANDPRNNAGNAILFGDQTQKYQIANRAFSEELRITSAAQQRLRWQAGVFFLTSRRDFTTIQGYNGRVPLNANGTPNIGISGYIPDPNGAIRADLTPPLDSIFGNRFTRLLIGGGTILPGLQINGLNTVNPTNAYDITRYTARNIAPFGNVQFDITQEIELGVALRYDSERRTVRTLTPNIINPFAAPNALTGQRSFNQCVLFLGKAPDACHAETTFDQFQPKVNLSYKVPEVATFYASYGKGFKSGGFNAFGSREQVIQGAQAGVASRAAAEAITFVQDAYNKEVTDAFEVGFKSQLWDRRVTLNGAAFYTDVNNAQQFSFFPAGSIQAVTSIDKVRIKGVEFDTSAALSDHFTLFGGFGYNDAKIRAFKAQPASVGNRAPYTLDYNFTVGVQFSQPVTDSLEFTARAEYNGMGSMWFDTANTPGTRRDPVGLLNVRIGIASERWEIAAWSRNLTDRKYNNESVVLPTGIGIFNPLFKAPTRSYGIESRVKF
jgi:iron complex outermembrane receptor protein